MPPHDHLYESVPNDGVSKLNKQRSELIYWIVGRFHELLAEGNDEMGFALMDEWFEWVDKKTYINESTVFFDGDELHELYKQSKS